MTAKQKANELVDKYVEYVEAYSSQGQIENAKICALIAVNEMIYCTKEQDTLIWLNDFYLDVKREIQAIKS